MWPFSKRQARPPGWLTDAQARDVVRIYYRDHDANCWYACALLASGEGVRIAASSEAMTTAHSLREEVALKSGRTLPVQGDA